MTGIFALMRNPATWVAAFLMTGGLLLIFGTGREAPLSESLTLLLTTRNLGFSLLFFGTFAYAYAAITSLRATRSFIEIDERARESGRQQPLDVIAAELRELAQVERVDNSKVDEIFRNQVSSHIAVPVSDFRSHFISLSNVLEEKARLSDEKASVLLDKGTFYVWVGIVFYLGSIIVWQVVISQATFRPEFIYGMVSCTFLFLFIEFLSAWFLKQYRQFVDTSTYLLKVKAIFDRYNLLFLAIAGESKDLSTDDAKAKIVSRALTDDFPWPADSHLSKADVAFAREALLSLSSLIRAARPGKREEEKD